MKFTFFAQSMKTISPLKTLVVNRLMTFSYSLEELKAPATVA